MVNLSLSDAPDMSPCRKLQDYTPFTSHADCMGHGINRVEMCEVILNCLRKWCIGNQVCFKFRRVLTRFWICWEI